MRYSIGLLVLLSLPPSIGCKSMTSTALNRRSNDVLVKDTHSTTGVPIRIKVPSHLQVHVTETVLLQNVNGAASDVKPNWQPVSLPNPMLNITSNLRYTDKIFTVDFKRPAAGTSKYEAEFSDEQYFTKISHELEDRTIKETSEAIQGILGTVLRGGSASLENLSAETHKDILTGERSVAWAEFDINACDFEEQVQAFVAQHLNNCHMCSNSPWNVNPTPSSADGPTVGESMFEPLPDSASRNKTQAMEIR